MGGGGWTGENLEIKLKLSAGASGYIAKLDNNPWNIKRKHLRDGNVLKNNFKCLFRLFMDQK